MLNSNASKLASAKKREARSISTQKEKLAETEKETLPYQIEDQKRIFYPVENRGTSRGQTRSTTQQRNKKTSKVIDLENEDEQSQVQHSQDKRDKKFKSQKETINTNHIN